MIERILFEIISVAGTLVSMLFIRWLMELSTPEEDWLFLERFLYRTYRQWKQGSFESFVIWYRARKLLDY